MNEWIQLIGGGFLLYLGAEWLVGGASSLARALRVPQLIVGLTVVAYGTSTPEIIVGIQAAGAGHSDVALGNVIGSNIANIGLILGVSALLAPARVSGALRKRERELPILVMCTALIPLVLINGIVGRLESGLLILLAVGYTSWMVHEARTAAAVAAAHELVASAGLAASTAGAPIAVSTRRAALIAVFGLAVLLVGGNLFVDGAVLVAQAFGMSERLVGLTIVALGTSLPELITSIVAARRGHSDLAVGNVIGSNIFNVLLCLGAAGLAGPVGAPLGTLQLELTTLAVMTLIAAWLIRKECTISRREGAMMLALYVAFVAATILRG